MSTMLILCFLFFMGSMFGWIIELFFRRFCSPYGRINKKWINPGFLIGPYLPIYGTGLCVLYIFAHINVSAFAEHPVLEKVVLFSLMAVAMTVVEYITGLIFIRGMHVKLWDYTNEWGNIQGIICPRFSFFWAVMSAIYYLLIHPFILDALYWLSENLAFSFVIGFFYGVLTIDLVVSFNIVVKVKRFADENQIIVKYENLRMKIRLEKERRQERAFFFLSMHTGTSFKKFFEEAVDNVMDKSDDVKENLKEFIDDIKELGEENKKNFEKLLEEIGTARKK